MSAKGLIGPLCLPPQQEPCRSSPSIDKSIELRQNPPYVTADEVKSTDVLVFKAVQHGCQIPAAAVQTVTVARRPSFSLIRRNVRQYRESGTYLMSREAIVSMLGS